MMFGSTALNRAKYLGKMKDLKLSCHLIRDYIFMKNKPDQNSIALDFKKFDMSSNGNTILTRLHQPFLYKFQTFRNT